MKSAVINHKIAALVIGAAVLALTAGALSTGTGTQLVRSSWGKAYDATANFARSSWG